MEKSTLTEDKAEKTPTGGVLVGKRKGQTIIHNKGTLSGYLVGKTHSEGGIKAVNKSTGQPLEMQGGEVVITAPAVSDQTKREFEGKMMTNREILSTINEKGGGVAFAKGGDIPKDIKRTGASYKYGGKTMTDHEIYKYITGGHLAEGYSLREIASIHQVPLSELKEQVRMGMKAESEHTPSKREQMKIVKDHLFENPKYYTLLKKAGLKHGGRVHRGSLVRDAKSGNTPARDLNNYNDVLDIDADGLYGAETGLYADGGMFKGNSQDKIVKGVEVTNYNLGELKEIAYNPNELLNIFKKFHKKIDFIDTHFFVTPFNNSGNKFKEIGVEIGGGDFQQIIPENISEHKLLKYLKGKYGGLDWSNFTDQSSKYDNGGTLDEYNFNFTVGAETGLYADGGMMKKGGLIAPNGKTSNLTPKQYKLVRTPEFKAWFGDWENDPENASKVVDENGEPLVVYHGAYDYGFTIFNKKFRGNTTNAKSSKKGFFFYDKKKDAEMFSKMSASGGIYEVFLKIKYPNIKNYNSENVDADKELVKLINSFEFDGAIALNIKDGFDIGNQYIVFEPNQIKLADGTNTKFDNMNSDIRYADGGDVKPYDANMEGDSADMMFAEGGAVSPVVDNWNEVPSIWKNTSKVKKVAFTNSPYDKGLYSIVAPFLGNDDLRPIMSGINFDENGITVTDAHKLISLPYPSKEFEGIYEADLSKRVNPEQITISGKYPNYAPIIPESKNTVKYEVDVYKLLQYTNVALKYANKTTFAVNYKIYDEVMGFNGKFLIEALTTLLKLGHDKVYGHFVGYTKAFVFSPNKNYELGNDDLILIMPVMVTGEKYLGAEDMLYGNNRKLFVYYDFNDNEIHNADGSIAEFKMTYASNSVINPDDVNLLQKLANGRNKLPILDYVLVENGVARASDLDSEYYLKGVDLPNGIYKTNKGALEITMEAMDDYPRNPIFVSDEDTLEFTINSDVFEYYVDKFQNVVGKDELRPVMQGICLHHTSDNKLFLAGTDANILLKVNITEYVNMPEVFKDMKFIIQPKRLYDFLNSTEHTTLRIKCNLVATTIESDSWSFYARNIDGNFPNYEAVIPREATKLVSVGIEPIKKAFNSEPIKTYIKETDKKLDIIIFNKEDEIFIAKSEGRYSANPFEVKDVEKLCETNVDFTLEDYYNDNKNVLLIMPYGYDKQTNFAFRKDLVDRVFKVVNSNKLDLHYTEMNRAYLIPIDTFDFKATTKEHKVREQKPSAEEIKLVSTINEINEIKEVIESLEILLENANRKDKKEIKETIEGLQILLDTYEY